MYDVQAHHKEPQNSLKKTVIMYVNIKINLTRRSQILKLKLSYFANWQTIEKRCDKISKRYEEGWSEVKKFNRRDKKLNLVVNEERKYACGGNQGEAEVSWRRSEKTKNDFNDNIDGKYITLRIHWKNNRVIIVEYPNEKEHHITKLTIARTVWYDSRKLRVQNLLLNDSHIRVARPCF